jgi:glycerol kinase
MAAARQELEGTVPTIAAIDQGTTSTRCVIFDGTAVRATAAREHRQYRPEPGWVEHDAAEIWAHTRATLTEAAGTAYVDAIGITNQRETAVAWDRRTGESVHPAIAWQDTRTSTRIDGLDHDLIRDRTGLRPAAYFSATKFAWILDQPGLRARAERGEVLLGTVDSWLIWNFTGGLAHVTDVTNASRTMLMNLHNLDWDPDLLDLFGVPKVALPRILPSAAWFGSATAFGGVPITAVLGDQQAALFGHAATAPGQLKATYGTGAFILVNAGTNVPTSDHGLLATVAYELGDDPAVYALEGSIAAAGSLIDWLRDNLRLFSSAGDIQALAESVPDAGGAVIVPAFSGLFAPYWRPDARGVISGLTGFVTHAHLARAALDAVAWQTRDVIDAIRAATGAPIDTINVDGGLTANALLRQLIADVTCATVARPVVAETTAFGVARAAGIGAGLWTSADAPTLPIGTTDAPRADGAHRDNRYRQWRKAVDRSLGWVDGPEGTTI